jgi:hypothetical protein
MRLFEVGDGITMEQAAPIKQIFKATKTEHFTRINKATGMLLNSTPYTTHHASCATMARPKGGVFTRILLVMHGFQDWGSRVREFSGGKTATRCNAQTSILESKRLNPHHEMLPHQNDQINPSHEPQTTDYCDEP